MQVNVEFLGRIDELQRVGLELEGARLFLEKSDPALGSKIRNIQGTIYRIRRKWLDEIYSIIRGIGSPSSDGIEQLRAVIGELTNTSLSAVQPQVRYLENILQYTSDYPNTSVLIMRNLLSKNKEFQVVLLSLIQET